MAVKLNMLTREYILVQIGHLCCHYSFHWY